MAKRLTFGEKIGIFWYLGLDEKNRIFQNSFFFHQNTLLGVFMGRKHDSDG
jgi:hypothetical protein